MKRRRINRKDILEDEKAEQILLELYKVGHGLADQIVERVLGTDTDRDEREEIIQNTLIGLAAEAEKLERMNLEKRLQYMSTMIWKAAIERSRDK